MLYLITKRSNRYIIYLTLIFVFAVIIRFLYFPQNVYFSYDQARDFYFAQDILKGDIRLIGPPSAANQNLFPGPLPLYIYAFIQLLFGKSPEIMSIFFRIYNALGVFLVFMIVAKLFNKRVALLSSILYTISYEQSQYSLIMSHQPLAVLSVLVFYLGLTMLIFKRKPIGLPILAFGLGLSIQFHYVYVFLLPILLINYLVFRQGLPKITGKYLTHSTLIFLATISTYIIAEFKFKFKTVITILADQIV